MLLIFLSLQENLPRDCGFKVVYKTCFRFNKVQTKKPAKGEGCPTHKGDWDPVRVHSSSLVEIRPMPTVKNPQVCRFRLCQYNQDGKCGQKDKCNYAHNQHELQVWRAEQAIHYPRPEPLNTKVPQLCEKIRDKEKKLWTRSTVLWRPQ